MNEPRIIRVQFLSVKISYQLNLTAGSHQTLENLIYKKKYREHTFNIFYVSESSNVILITFI